MGSVVGGVAGGEVGAGRVRERDADDDAGGGQDGHRMLWVVPFE